MGTKIKKRSSASAQKGFQGCGRDQAMAPAVFECKEIRKEPPMNTSGFWKKPKHGLLSEKEASNWTR